MKLIKLLGMASVLFVVSMQELSGATLVNQGGRLGGMPTPWFWASAKGTQGIKYGYGANPAAAQENAKAVADGRANPAQFGAPTTYTGSYTAMYGGVSKTATATSTVSQADANARAQQAWNAQNRMYTGNLFGSFATSTLSQVDANAKARLAWLSARLSGGAIIDKNNYAARGWTEISNGARGNLQMTFTALATNDLHIGLKYGNSNYLEIVIGGWDNRKSVVRIFENGRQKGPDIVATGPVPTNPNALVIPNIGSAIPLTLTINENNLMVKNGTTTLVSCSDPAFNQIFTAYSFRTYEAFSFAIHNCVLEVSVDSKEASIQALIGSMQSLLPNSKVVRGSIGNNPKLETQFGRDVTDLKISFKAVTKKDIIVCLRTKDGYLGISLPAQGNQGRIYYTGGDSLAWPNKGMMPLGVPLNLEIKIYKNVLSIAGLTAPCEINLNALSALSTAGKAYTSYFFEGSDSASPWVVADEAFEELKQLVDPLVQSVTPVAFCGVRPWSERDQELFHAIRTVSEKYATYILAQTNETSLAMDAIDNKYASRIDAMEKERQALNDALNKKYAPMLDLKNSETDKARQKIEEKYKSKMDVMNQEIADATNAINKRYDEQELKQPFTGTYNRCVASSSVSQEDANIKAEKLWMEKVLPGCNVFEKYDMFKNDGWLQLGAPTKNPALKFKVLSPHGFEVAFRCAQGYVGLIFSSSGPGEVYFKNGDPESVMKASMARGYVGQISLEEAVVNVDGTELEQAPLDLIVIIKDGELSVSGLKKPFSVSLDKLSSLKGKSVEYVSYNFRATSQAAPFAVFDDHEVVAESHESAGVPVVVPRPASAPEGIGNVFFSAPSV